jgi:chorismate mutase
MFFVGYEFVEQELLLLYLVYLPREGCVIWCKVGHERLHTTPIGGSFFMDFFEENNFMKVAKLQNQIFIVGPCAVESREQVLETVAGVRATGVDFMRMSLWKPRTRPGFEGIGEAGIDLVVEAAKMGVNPAVEPIVPEHAAKVVEAVLTRAPKAKLLLWIGARNQNHIIQREIARIAAADERIYLMVKNQVWSNEKHWEGIVEHVLSGGIKKSRLFLCHRGFASMGENPSGYRNVPDYDMALRMREKTGLPMIFDPSHTGGSVEKVFKITEEAAEHGFDGYIVEVHPKPKTAMSDANQQLTWREFQKLLKLLYNKRKAL